MIYDSLELLEMEWLDFYGDTCDLKTELDFMKKLVGEIEELLEERSKYPRRNKNKINERIVMLVGTTEKFYGLLNPNAQ